MADRLGRQFGVSADLTGSFAAADIDITATRRSGQRVRLFTATDGYAGLGVCCCRGLVGFIHFDQPAQRVRASAAQFSRFIDRSCADTLNAWGRLIVADGADAAILLG